jgi:hypothetical protein
MTDHARKVLAHQAAQTEAPEPETTEVVPADPAFQSQTTYAVKRRVTMPVLPFPIGATYVLRPLEAIHQSQIEDSKFPPARVCQVEAPNGEVRLLIVGEVLLTALNRAYPNDGYVGLWFQISKVSGPTPERRYADYAVTEIVGPARDAA